MNETEKPQQKFIDFSEFKSIDSDSGGWSGYANNFGVLDSYDDITLPGAFADGLKEFLETGFGAVDHSWGIRSEIGIPVKAYEDQIGLYLECAYHPTDDAQTVRQKVNNRLKHNKKVCLSIGYRCVKDGYEYVVGEEAAPFLINPSQTTLDYLKNKQPLVRLLKKVKLYEGSIVSVGANCDSQIQEAKSFKRAEFDSCDSLQQAKRIQILNLKLRSISA